MFNERGTYLLESNDCINWTQPKLIIPTELSFDNYKSVFDSQPCLFYNKSENYIWVNRKYQSFIYIDRVIIEAKNRNKGLGVFFYNDLVKSFQGKVENIICEVNVKPYNSQSLYFHEKYGFKEIGQKDTENGTKRVSYLLYKMNKSLK